MKKYIDIKNIAASLLVLLFAVTSMFGSSHREAPLISNDPLADNVDLYAFRSPDNPDMITMIATYVPLQLPHGGPNYYTFGQNIRYEIHVDNDASVPGDEITYRFTFNIVNEDPTTFFNIRLGKQNQKATYTLERSMDGGNSFETIITDGVVPPNNIGPRSIESGVGLNTTYGTLFNDAITTASTGETVFAGPTDDPFFVDLGGIFDLGDSPRQDGKNVDGLACLNVSAIAIQVPISVLRKASAPAAPTSILDADYVIGVWASASRPAITTLSKDSDPTVSGDWIQVSRIGMPLTNEAVIAIGDKDYWNSITPYEEIAETTMDEYFYNPELALYMDDSQFGGAVPSFGPLRIQSASLGSFDFRNGKDGLFGLKGNAALAGTALDDAVFGTLLLPAAGKPRSVDLWPIFHTGVPNVIPYQLATGKAGNPLAAGKPFINNFLPNGGDMLRLNMAVPVTPRDDANFSTLGLVQAAAIGLTVAPFNTTSDLEFIPNMDGFPNGRRLEDDVTRIELQAVGGVVLAAVGLWYDDYDPATSASPVTQDLLNVLTYTTGVESNDKAFTGSFPYLAQPHSGTGPCSGELQFSEQPPLAEADAQVFVSSNTSGKIGVYGFADDGSVSASTYDAAGADADGVYYDKEGDVLYQLNRSDNVINAYSDVSSGTPSLTATSSSDFVNGREIAFSNGKLVVAQDANGANGMVNQFVVYNASGSSISLDKTITTDINLWGITFAGDDLIAVVDNSNDVAVYTDFLSTQAGSASPSRVIDVNGIVRTHGLDYDETNDVMVLTDVGDAGSSTDGTIMVINNWTTASADNSVRGNEQNKISGPNSFLGNPVDVAYDHAGGKLYVAERANGGGRFLTFDIPTGDNRDITPIANEFFPGASAVTIADCRDGEQTGGNNDPIDGCSNVFVSSNTTGTVGAFDCSSAGSLSSTTFSVTGTDADGIYYDKRDDAIYQINRSDNVVEVYVDVSSGSPTLSATSSSDFINGRELAYSRGKIVVAQDANDANGNLNQLVLYSARTNRIRLQKVFTVDINLWGITFDGDDLVAVIDNSNDIAIYNDFTRQEEGSVSPDRVVSINGLVRTHGLDYDSRNDIMVLTDVGAASSPTDGAIIYIEDWSVASADGTISGSEQNRIEGPNSLLGNPVDVHYDHSGQKIFVAERANDGGRFLVFDIPTGDGDVAPAKMASFPGASAVNMGCRSNPGSGSNGNGGEVVNPDPQTIVYYSLDQCQSRTGSSQTHVDYSEFKPVYPNSLNCASVSANNVQRDNPTAYPHSCTRGVLGSPAMCVSSSNSCTYRPNDPNAVTFKVTLDPQGSSEAFISGLTFYEKTPLLYDWIGGASGVNNYPTKYGVRVLKDGIEIFSSIGQDASPDWTLETFDFSDDAFTVSERAEFIFEFLGYCTVGNGADVNAWDLDEISVIGGCNNAGSSLISGLVFTESGDPIEGVEVWNNTDLPEYPVASTTNGFGEFVFDSNPEGQDYLISTIKNDDFTNGVSTMDIVKIQRHILGLEVMDSPYDMIAADVNRSMSISAADLVSMRKVILGIDDKFEGNYSWLFIDTDVALDNRYPFAFESGIELTDLNDMVYDNDFVGVKVGDVNGSVIANSAQRTAEVRSDISLDLKYNDMEITKGRVYNIDITSSNFEDVYGFQFTTELNGIELLDVKSNTLDITTDNVGFIRPEIATISYATGYAISSDVDATLFTLQVKATQTGMLSDMINISSSVTPIEAYINNSFEEVSIKLEAHSVPNANAGFALYQNTPNPFNTSTDITFNMKHAGEAAITIFDTAGKKIYQSTQTYTKGYNSVTIESSELRSSSNILFYQLSTEGFTATKKMTLID